MASLAVIDDPISFQEQEREISPAINVEVFSKLVTRLLFKNIISRMVFEKRKSLDLEIW